MVNYKDVMNTLEVFEQELRTIIPSIKTLIHIDVMCIKVEASFQDVEDVRVRLTYFIETKELLNEPLYLKRILERFKTNIDGYAIITVKQQLLGM